MRYRVTHTTTYKYHEAISLSQHALRLRPRSLPGQTCLDYRVSIEPVPKKIESHTDYFGNSIDFVALEQPHSRLVIESVSDVHRLPVSAADPKETASWEQARDLGRGCQIGAA